MFLSGSWRWRTIQDCEMTSSPDTLRVLFAGFAEVVKMTNHTGPWEDELAWYFSSTTHWTGWGHDGNEPHWTVRWKPRLILSECYLPNLSRLWRWLTAQDCEMTSSPDTLRVLLAGFTFMEHGFGIYGFRPIWPSLGLWELARNFFNHPVINSSGCFRSVMA